jgi:DNA-binding ferritin-like protein (Dps family)
LLLVGFYDVTCVLEWVWRGMGTEWGVGRCDVAGNGILMGDEVASRSFFNTLSTSLKHLNLGENRFTALPEDFLTRRPLLSSLKLGRGFADPPDDVVKKGRGAILEYFAAKRFDGTERTSNMRLLYVGRGGMGKTSLLNALTSADGTAPAIPLDDRTEGVAIHRVTLDGIDCAMWDFAGQDVYYHGHKLFLSSRCVYLLVMRAPVAVECFESRDDGPLMDSVKLAVDGWVRQVQGRAPNATIVPIVTHSASFHDRGHCALHSRFVDLVGRRLKELADALNDEVAGEWRELQKQVEEAVRDGDKGSSDVARLRERLEQIQRSERDGSDVARLQIVLRMEGGPFCVDSRSGEGIDALRGALVATMRSQSFFGEELPRAWTIVLDVAKGWKSDGCVAMVDVEEFVVAVRDAFKARRGGKEISAEFVMGGVKFWACLGEVIVRWSPVRRCDVVFPQPQQLIDAIRPLLHHDLGRRVGAKALFEQVEAFKVRGVLKEELLQEMWRDVVAPEARESVVDLLSDCGIVTSFSDPDEPDSVSYVVPAHILPQEVDFSMALARCPVFCVQYRLSTLPQGLVEGIRCLMWLRHFRILRPHFNILSAPNDVCVFSQSASGSSCGCVSFFTSASTIKISATSRGMLRFCAGLVETVMHTDSFVGLRVKCVEAFMGDKEREVWVARNVTRIESAMGARLQMKAMYFSRQLSEQFVSNIFGWEGLDGWGESVFFSHKWGDWTDTSGLVRLLREELHSATPLQTWCDFDIFPDGRVGMGTRFKEGMESGVAGAAVAVLFLTKEYLNSEPCVFEATRSFELGLAIIPLVFDEEVKFGSSYWREGSPLWHDEHKQRVRALGEKLKEVQMFDHAIEWRQTARRDERSMRRVLKDMKHASGRNAIDLFVSSVLENALQWRQGAKDVWGDVVSRVARLATDNAVVSKRTCVVPVGLERRLFSRLTGGGGAIRKYELLRGFLDVGLTYADVDKALDGREGMSEEQFCAWVKDLSAASEDDVRTGDRAASGLNVEPAAAAGQTKFSILAAAFAKKPSLQKYVPLLQSAGLDDALLADVDGDELDELLADLLSSIAPAYRKLIVVEIKRAVGEKRRGSGERTGAVKLFERLDANRDGVISFSELCAFMSDFGFSDEEIHASFVAADADGSGGLSVDEFRANFSAHFAFQ